MATAVLVHGGWWSPADWRWVADRLHDRDIQVVIPDLPSHRRQDAHRSDDVREVEAAVRSAAPLVVVAAWSYGGGVIGELAEPAAVSRFIYVGAFPRPPEYFSSFPRPTEAELRSIPHVLFSDEAVVLDDGWWLGSEEVAGFPTAVRCHLREHPRRPHAKRAFLEHFLEPSPRESWRSVPTTILIGRSDSGIPAEEQQWVRSSFEDVRIVDGDHFLLLLRPQLVAGVIAETFTISS